MAELSASRGRAAGLRSKCRSALKSRLVETYICIFSAKFKSVETDTLAEIVYCILFVGSCIGLELTVSPADTIRINLPFSTIPRFLHLLVSGIRQTSKYLTWYVCEIDAPRKWTQKSNSSTLACNTPLACTFYLNNQLQSTLCTMLYLIQKIQISGQP
jgi:hypothetical protein